MKNNPLHLVFAILSFGLAFVVYTLTVQPSLPFWDCGEFSSAAIWQQVPHPPGAPLFLLIGKMFHILIPFGDEGWRINMVSVVSSAITILLLYLITVMVIRNFRKDERENLGTSLAVYGSSFIAAAAFTFSDTFWFNAVESEVYAFSSLIVAIVVYLMMKWNEEADSPGHEKYLLLIAYLIGLSTGAHLLSILTIFSIVMVVYFRKYEFRITSFLIMGVIAVFIFFLVYPVIVQWIPAFLAGHTAGRNEAMEYSINDSLFLQLIAICAILGAIYGFVVGVMKKNDILKLATLSFLLVLMGYTTYTQILLRSNANPPMNENEPKNFTRLSSYIGREQYGNAPTWPRRYQTEDYFIQNYEKKDKAGNFIYGKWNPPGRREVRRSDGTSVTAHNWNRVNTAGELAFFWKYQIQHMYFRYLYWNFVGRMSDVQDAGSAWFSYDKSEADALNYKSGYADLFPIRFFALPLLFGLIGLFFHFKRDPRMALVYLIMFLLMGVLAAIQQNQQEPQPRERDYFYAGSFMVFALWIGLGAFSLIEWLARQKMKTTISAAVIAASFLLVPLNMAIGGWKLHSRAGNYLPFDYSYNILQSTEQNAIIFTNGDNDTFPLWYIQDVAGVRRDVRVVNLSLGNTLWYVDQLKNRQPWGSEKIPLSFADDSLQGLDETDPRALSYDFGEPMEIAIPVRREILEQYTNDPQILADGHMRFTFTGKPFRKVEDKMFHIFRVQDKLILDILRETKFERPVYFSNTVGSDAFTGLEGHFRVEGMAYRICPVRQGGRSGESIEMNITEQCLMNIDNSDNFSKEPKYGFKFRNLNNSSVYYDEVHRRLMHTYRQLYFLLADNYLANGDKDKAIKALDMMNEMISYTQFPMPVEFQHRTAKLYYDAGDIDKAKKFADIAIKSCLELIENDNLKPEYTYYEIVGKMYGPFRYASELYEMIGDLDGAALVLERLYKLSDEMRGQMFSQGFSQNEIQRIDQNLADIRVSVDLLKINDIYKKGNKREAYEEAKKIRDGYQTEQTNLGFLKTMIIMRRISEIEQELGIAADNPQSGMMMFR